MSIRIVLKDLMKNNSVLQNISLVQVQQKKKKLMNMVT